MNSAKTIETITITGFRAFARAQTFSLPKGKCLAILAPNAKGKSSFVDALEFYLSSEGTLERLGERAAGTRAGREPLIHVEAAKDGSESSVTVGFRGDVGAPIPRHVSRAGSALTPAARTIIGLRRVDSIIRGHELRAFVERQTPEERYAEVSGWFGFASLVDVQKNLRAVRNLLTRKLGEYATLIGERMRDTQQLTGSTLTQWDDVSIATWVNASIPSARGSGIQFRAISKADPAYAALQRLVALDAASAGTDALAQIEAAIGPLLPRSGQGEDPKERVAGSVTEFEDAVAALAQAQEAADRERVRLGAVLFKDVWEAASLIFKDPDIAPEICPVCETPIVGSQAGSVEAVKLHLETELAGLKAFREADANREVAESLALGHNEQLKVQLSAAIAALKVAGSPAEAEAVSRYLQLVQRWQVSAPAPESLAVTATLRAVFARLGEQLKGNRAGADGRTSAMALAGVDRLLTIRDRLDVLCRSKLQLQHLMDSLGEISGKVDSEIRTHVQSTVGRLKATTNDLFRSVQLVHQGPLPEIRLELAEAGDRNQQRLSLVFDFAEDRKGVVPQGYLSDAQIHTLALSLRLAAIMALNRGFPVIVLDDVVTSYDADHRRSLAGAIAEKLRGFQTILVTHDSRFFYHLQEAVPPEAWDFKRIIALDRRTGPKFQDQGITAAMIEERWARGELAANEIRQAEEEWLLARCREFRALVEIREIHRPYSYERAELAAALQRAIKSAGLVVPDDRGVKNKFLTSLQSGAVENFGSHFQEDPYGVASEGDERKRWQEFQQFCALFTCSGCKADRLKYPRGLNRPVCQRCEKPFEFNAPTPSVGLD